MDQSHKNGNNSHPSVSFQTAVQQKSFFTAGQLALSVPSHASVANSQTHVQVLRSTSFLTAKKIEKSPVNQNGRYGVWQLKCLPVPQNISATSETGKQLLQAFILKKEGQIIRNASPNRSTDVPALPIRLNTPFSTGKSVPIEITRPPITTTNPTISQCIVQSVFNLARSRAANHCEIQPKTRRSQDKTGSMFEAPSSNRNIALSHSVYFTQSEPTLCRDVPITNCASCQQTSTTLVSSLHCETQISKGSLKSPLVENSTISEDCSTFSTPVIMSSSRISNSDSVTDSSANMRGPCHVDAFDGCTVSTKTSDPQMDNCNSTSREVVVTGHDLENQSHETAKTTTTNTTISSGNFTQQKDMEVVDVDEEDNEDCVLLEVDLSKFVPPYLRRIHNTSVTIDSDEDDDNDLIILTDPSDQESMVSDPIASDVSKPVAENVNTNLLVSQNSTDSDMTSSSMRKTCTALASNPVMVPANGKDMDCLNPNNMEKSQRTFIPNSPIEKVSLDGDADCDKVEKRIISELEIEDQSVKERESPHLKTDGPALALPSTNPLLKHDSLPNRSDISFNCSDNPSNQISQCENEKSSSTLQMARNLLNCALNETQRKRTILQAVRSDAKGKNNSVKMKRKDKNTDMECMDNIPGGQKKCVTGKKSCPGLKVLLPTDREIFSQHHESSTLGSCPNCKMQFHHESTLQTHCLHCSMKSLSTEVSISSDDNISCKSSVPEECYSVPTSAYKAESEWRCSHCKRKFSTHPELQEHISSSTVCLSRIKRTSKCHNDISHSKELIKSSHSSSSTFSCETGTLCSTYTFSSEKSALAGASLDKSSVKTPLSPHKSFVTVKDSLTQIIQNTAEVQPQKVARCESCNTWFSSYASFKKHFSHPECKDYYDRMHGKQEKLPQQNCQRSSEKPDLSCPVCNLKFSVKADLILHVTSSSKCRTKVSKSSKMAARNPRTKRGSFVSSKSESSTNNSKGSLNVTSCDLSRRVTSSISVTSSSAINKDKGRFCGTETVQDPKLLTDSKLSRQFPIVVLHHACVMCKACYEPFSSDSALARHLQKFQSCLRANNPFVNNQFPCQRCNKFFQSDEQCAKHLQKNASCEKRNDVDTVWNKRSKVKPCHCQKKTNCNKNVTLIMKKAAFNVSQMQDVESSKKKGKISEVEENPEIYSLKRKQTNLEKSTSSAGWNDNVIETLSEYSSAKRTRLANSHALYQVKNSSTNEENDGKTSELFDCLLCQAAFPTLNSLMHHSNQHQEEISLKCDRCGLVFLHYNRFISHKAFHIRMDKEASINTPEHMSLKVSDPNINVDPIILEPNRSKTRRINTEDNMNVSSEKLTSSDKLTKHGNCHDQSVNLSDGDILRICPLDLSVCLKRVDEGTYKNHFTSVQEKKIRNCTTFQEIYTSSLDSSSK